MILLIKKYNKKTKKQIEFSTKKENIKEDFNNFEYISYNTAYEKKIIFHINLMRILIIKEVFCLIFIIILGKI